MKGECRLMLIDDDWCRLMQIDADLCWLMLLDADWCSNKVQWGVLLWECTSGVSPVIVFSSSLGRKNFGALQWRGARRWMLTTQNYDSPVCAGNPHKQYAWKVKIHGNNGNQCYQSNNVLPKIIFGLNLANVPDPSPTSFGDWSPWIQLCNHFHIHKFIYSPRRVLWNF